MNCENAFRLISAELDDELDPPSLSLLEAHIANCQHCQQQRQNLINLKNNTANQIDYHRAPNSLRAALEKKLSDNHKTTRSFKPVLSEFFPLQTVAAFALLLLGIGLGLQIKPSSSLEQLTDQVVSGHIRSLMVDHLTDVASTDQHTVKPWFNGKLDFSPQVMNFSDQGFPLIGGRLDFLDAKTVSALIYKRRQHIINVFICPQLTNQLVTEYSTARKGFNVMAFNFQGMSYWLVSDLNSQELMELKEDIIKQP